MRNVLKPQSQRGIPAMAGLLLTALCCIPLQGCLFPQDDDQVIGELPPKRNGPLRIGTATPSGPRVTFYNSTACPDKQPAPFSLTVSDEDLADLVYSRWYIGGTLTPPFDPTPVPGGKKEREVTAPTSLGFRTALANLPAGTEILTVYVGDTDWKEAVGGDPVLVERTAVLPDGTTVDDPGTFDSFTWTLIVEPCP